MYVLLQYSHRAVTGQPGVPPRVNHTLHTFTPLASLGSLRSFKAHIPCP